MALPDEVLELIFHFLLAKKVEENELKVAARPVCRLLQTRRLRDFQWATLEVCRMGLQWALGDRKRLQRELRDLRFWKAELVWNV